MTMIGRARSLVLMFVAVAALLGACGGTNSSNDGGTACGTTSCSASQVCLREQTVGGGQICPGDGGTCPSGSELMQGCCVQIPAWSCEPRPAGCGASVTCACAAATLCTSGQTCTMPRANEIDCTLLAP